MDITIKKETGAYWVIVFFIFYYFQCPSQVCGSLTSLVDYLCKEAPNDLFKVRSIFRWIAHNIRYDWKYMGVSLTSSDVLKLGEGVCKDYCLLFEDMSTAA